MSTLAEGLPCLVGKPGVRPWDPEQLDAWASRPEVTTTELHAARFVLNVWDGKREWHSGRFDLLDALDELDEQHRAAFASWIMDPWWPLSLCTATALREHCLRDTLRPED